MIRYEAEIYARLIKFYLQEKQGMQFFSWGGEVQVTPVIQSSDRHPYAQRILWTNMACFCGGCWMSRSKRPCWRGCSLEMSQARGSQHSPSLCSGQSHILTLAACGSSQSLLEGRKEVRARGEEEPALHGKCGTGSCLPPPASLFLWTSHFLLQVFFSSFNLEGLNSIISKCMQPQTF